MSNKDFTADFSEGEHHSPGIHDAGIEPTGQAEPGQMTVKCLQWVLHRFLKTEYDGDILKWKWNQTLWSSQEFYERFLQEEGYNDPSDQTALLSRQLLRSEQNLKETKERIRELEPKESELSEVKKWIEIQREVVKAKDEQITRLQQLIWKSFLLSVCDLPESEQQEHWKTFKKENGLPEALNPSSKTTKEDI